jgi:hypothetical protein
MPRPPDHDAEHIAFVEGAQPARVHTGVTVTDDVQLPGSQEGNPGVRDGVIVADCHHALDDVPRDTPALDVLAGCPDPLTSFRIAKREHHDPARGHRPAVAQRYHAITGAQRWAHAVSSDPDEQ